MDKKYVVCSECGSDDVVFDAWARWDPDLGEFVLSHHFESDPCCNECGNHDFEWKDEEPTYDANDISGLMEYPDVPNEIVIVQRWFYKNVNADGTFKYEAGAVETDPIIRTSQSSDGCWVCVGLGRNENKEVDGFTIYMDGVNIKSADVNSLVKSSMPEELKEKYPNWESLLFGENK